MFDTTPVGTAIGRLTMGRYDPSDTQPMTGAYFELHRDGSAFGAVPLYGQKGDDGPWQVFDEPIVDGCAGLLSVAVAHMLENASSWGDADVEARLLEPRNGTEPPSHSMVLFGYRNLGGMSMLDRHDGTRPVFTVAASRHTVAASAVAGDLREWLLASRFIAADLLHGFGLQEPLQITSDGSLRLGGFEPQARSMVASWATANGLDVV